MNAPVEIQKPIASQENQLFGLVEKVLSSANPDMAVIEKMLDMQERVLAKQAEMAFNRDFAMMSNEIPVIEKTADSHMTKYTPLEDLVKITRPILSKYGFAISFHTEQNSIKEITVICEILHREGHKIKNSLTLPTDAVNKGMNSMQAIGAAISYGKRYTLCAVLNIATSNDKDNNGFTENAKKILPRMKPARFSNALDAIKSGDFTKEDLFSEYTLTDEQKAQVEAL